MTDLLLQKLKVSLTSNLNDWINKETASGEWAALGTSVGDFTAELMADAAFTVLMAQKDLTEYYEREEMLNYE